MSQEIQPTGGSNQEIIPANDIGQEIHAIEVVNQVNLNVAFVSSQKSPNKTSIKTNIEDQSPNSFYALLPPLFKK